MPVLFTPRRLCLSWLVSVTLTSLLAWTCLVTILESGISSGVPSDISSRPEGQAHQYTVMIGARGRHLRRSSSTRAGFEELGLRDPDPRGAISGGESPAVRTRWASGPWRGCPATSSPSRTASWPGIMTMRQTHFQVVSGIQGLR